MKKPSLRITKFLGNEIPVDGECTACEGALFQINKLPLAPDPEVYRAKLQEKFDEHFKKVHLREDASQAAARVVREATEDH